MHNFCWIPMLQKLLYQDKVSKVLNVPHLPWQPRLLRYLLAWPTESQQKKITGGPDDPGASLPVGDGLWILLSLAGAYSISLIAYNRFFSGLTR